MALSIVEKWCEEVKLGVNPSKSELIIFTKRRNLSGYFAPKLFNKELKAGTKVKYLGVIYTPTLNWGEHIANRINKCIRIFWCCRRAIGRTWGLSPKNLLWLHTAIVRPMMAYGIFNWWTGIQSMVAQKTLTHLQRVVCLAITGAGRTTPQAALESILYLPPLHVFLETEAATTAFRLRRHINNRWPWRQNHSSILDKLYGHCELLGAPVDKMEPTYLFRRPYRTVVPERDSWLNVYDDGNPHIIRWFTDASVNENGSGYGIFNANTGTEICGP